MPVCQMPQLHVSSLYLRFDMLRGTGILLNRVISMYRHFFSITVIPVVPLFGY